MKKNVLSRRSTINVPHESRQRLSTDRRCLRLVTEDRSILFASQSWKKDFQPGIVVVPEVFATVTSESPSPVDNQARQSGSQISGFVHIDSRRTNSILSDGDAPSQSRGTLISDIRNEGLECLRRVTTPATKPLGIMVQAESSSDKSSRTRDPCLSSTKPYLSGSMLLMLEFRKLTKVFS